MSKGTIIRTRAPGAAVAALAAVALIPAGRLAADPTGERDPVAVEVAWTTEGQAARVTLTFSRRVDYSLEETGARLRLSVEDAIDEASRVDRRITSDVLRRIRFDRTRRGTDIVFYLGREFKNFSLSELDNPFRVIVLFHGTAQDPPLPLPGRDGEIEEAVPLEDRGVYKPPPPALPDISSLSPRVPGDVRRVVLDPGHGGQEEGAVGPAGLKEKDLVLDIARHLGDRLRGMGYEVSLTRETDQDLDLPVRTAMANNLRADLFLSIHANASARAGARGAEAYFLAWGATDPEAARVAAHESRVHGPAESGIDLVLWEMAQAAHLGKSSRLADLLQRELDTISGTRSRGVKQAPFRVLVGAAMPAVLVEVGFLSHPDEESLLAGTDYRDRIAAALATAIENFRAESIREAESARGAGPAPGGFDGGGRFR